MHSIPMHTLSSPPRHTRSNARYAAALLATLLAAAALAACGADKPAGAWASPTGPTPTPTSLLDPAFSGPAWQTSPAAAGIPGGVAFNPTLSLRDGSEATLEQLAGGKPLLFYFFATW
jgi:hypothetical protein